jgi:hypothetical protein
VSIDLASIHTDFGKASDFSCALFSSFENEEEVGLEYLRPAYLPKSKE